MVIFAIALTLVVSTPDSTMTSQAQESANAIISCQLRRVDASYRNPQNPGELRLLDQQNAIAIGFSAVGSSVDVGAIRLFDPGRVFGGNRISEVSWNSQTRGFLIKTEQGGEGAVSLVISGPEAGYTTLGAIAVRTDEAAIRTPLAYMFNGRCGLMPSRNLVVDFDTFVAALGSRP